MLNPSMFFLLAVSEGLHRVHKHSLDSPMWKK